MHYFEGLSYFYFFHNHFSSRIPSDRGDVQNAVVSTSKQLGEKREKGHQSFVQSVSTCLNVVTQHSIYLAKNIFSFTSPVGEITKPPLSTELRNPRREGSGQVYAESTRPRPDCIQWV